MALHEIAESHKDKASKDKCGPEREIQIEAVSSCGDAAKEEGWLDIKRFPNFRHTDAEGRTEYPDFCKR